MILKDTNPRRKKKIAHRDVRVTLRPFDANGCDVSIYDRSKYGDILHSRTYTRVTEKSLTRVMKVAGGSEHFPRPEHISWNDLTDPKFQSRSQLDLSFRY